MLLFREATQILVIFAESHLIAVPTHNRSKVQIVSDAYFAKVLYQAAVSSSTTLI